jgi:GTPase SAR1 family protein
MSTIIRRFMKQLLRNSNDEYTITIAGLGNSGKTTLTYLLKLGEVVQTIPSIGFNVENVEVPLPNGKQLKFIGWDVGAGCASPKVLSLMISTYCTSADALIWVVDSAEREWLKESVETFGKVIEATQPGDPGVRSSWKNRPILMFAPPFLALRHLLILRL